MRLLFTAAVFFSLGFVASAQTSIQEYLHLRRSHQIVRPASVETLNRLIGTRVVEIQGTVTGSFRTGNVVSLMLQRTDGETQILNCPNGPPDWLLNGEVAVRVLAQVNRASADGALTADMIAAEPEDQVRRYDAPDVQKAVAKRRSRKNSVLESRGNGGMRALHGWIGGKAPRGWTRNMLDAIPAYTDFILKVNRSLSEAEATRIADGVIEYSTHYGLDARLIMAVILAESEFHPLSTSVHGAMGLGQLMPETAAWMGVQHPYDEIENINGMVKLLRTHLDQYMAQTGGDEMRALELALAAYNAGEGAVRRHGGVPPYPETEAYISKVITYFNEFCSQG